MKQAILITAYRDFDQLKNLLTEFDHTFNLYVHIDRNSVIPAGTFDELSRLPNVKYFAQDFKIKWGGVNHLKAYLKLAEIALADPENVYFQLITGQDFPIQSNEYFHKLATGEASNYMESFKLPSSRWREGGLQRVTYYNFCDLIDAKRNAKWVNRLIRLQRAVKFRRSLKDFPGDIYGGSTYWSLSREVLAYVMEYTRENPRFLRRFDHTFCAEEMYFQTVIMNSRYAPQIMNNSKRYIDWERESEGSPGFLHEGDCASVIGSNNLFARKISSGEVTLINSLRAFRKPTGVSSE